MTETSIIGVYLSGVLSGVVAAVVATAVVVSSRASKPRERELLFCQWERADFLLKQNIGWRLAPEEDTNSKSGWVYLERDLPLERI